MVIRFCLWLAVALTWMIPAAAAPRWIRIESQHFEVYSSAGERATRDTIKHFEQVRQFFSDAFGGDGKFKQPVRIVIFGSKREYEPYTANEFASAYYRSGAERDYIVLSEAGLSSYPIATHEYVHLIANHAGMNLPPWLNEGMAELYSTLKAQGNKILVGSWIEGRQQELLRERWIPLATICSAGRASAYYNEKDKVGALYNEGWALTHMLALSPEYRAGFQGFVKAIMAGLDTEGAMMKVYSRTMKRMDAEVQAYIQREIIQAVLIPVKLAKIETELPAEPASGFGLRLTLAELSDRPGKAQDVAVMLQEIAKDYPAQHEIHSALGYQQWRQGRREQACVHFGKAYELGSRSPRFLWDYSRLARGKDDGRASAAISALLEIEPGRTDARIELAELQLAAGLKKEARETMGSIGRVTPELATRLFQVLAYVELANGNVEQAKKAAARWEQSEVSPAGRESAGRFAAFLAKAAQTYSTAPAQEVVAGEQRTNVARSDPAAPPPLEPEPSFLFTGKAEGLFVELQCKDSQAVFVIEVEGARQSYLIDDPLKITIAGANGASMGLTCGKQVPKPVKLEFNKPGEGQTSIRGLLRLVDFGS